MRFLKHKTKNIFGLSINETALKAIQISEKNKMVHIDSYSSVELESGTITNHATISNPEAFQKSVEKLIKKSEIKGTNVILSIPDKVVFSHTIIIPAEEEGNHSVIMRTARDYVPIDFNEAITDYKLISRSETSLTYTFSAIPKKIIDSITVTLKNIGIEVVAIDIDKNSVLRTCDNPLLDIKKDILSLRIYEKRVVLDLKTSTGAIHQHSINIQSGHLNNHKEGAKNIKISKEVLVIAMQIADFIHLINNKESITLRSVFIFSHQKGHELIEALKKQFPEADFFEGLSYLDNKQNLLDVVPVVGLALRGMMLKEFENEINLISSEKREAVTSIRLQPYLIKGLSFLFILLSVIFVSLSFLATKTYIHKVTIEKEAQWAAEKTQNPYLNNLANDIQQNNQVLRQINSLLQKSIPASLLMSIVDSHNSLETMLVNAQYILNKNGLATLGFRSKVIDRPNTEKLIISFEESPYFDDIVSPLSNLVGKGERFVNINMSINLPLLMQHFDRANAEKLNQFIKEKTEENNTEETTNEEDNQLTE